MSLSSLQQTEESVKKPAIVLSGAQDTSTYIMRARSIIFHRLILIISIKMSKLMT